MTHLIVLSLWEDQEELEEAQEAEQVQTAAVAAAEWQPEEVIQPMVRPEELEQGPAEEMERTPQMQIVERAAAPETMGAALLCCTLGGICLWMDALLTVMVHKAGTAELRPEALLCTAAVAAAVAAAAVPFILCILLPCQKQIF